MCRPKVLTLFQIDLERHERFTESRKAFVKRMKSRYDISRATVYRWIRRVSGVGINKKFLALKCGKIARW